ncbi:MAG: aldose 1-epimerase [Sphingomonas sp.]|nr:aldose 1-epimerase [Sphingomonas sp.]
MTQAVTLAAGSLELELAASVGGAIARFDHVEGGQRTPVLRPSPRPLRTVLDAASFPLVPFVNRIGGGAFEFRVRQVRLDPNMAGDPSPLHGQGWLGPWRVERSSASEADLLFEHQAGEWPWAYESRQHFVLDSGGLDTRISCRNTSDEPMPCGLGIHPYFNCGPGTRIRTGVEHVWTVDENVLPVDRVPATGQYDIADSPVCGRGLDNGYDGWSGKALFTDPAWPFDIALISPGERYFQLYSPVEGGIFVAEPVSHANDALSAPEAQWAELGIRILEPGETMELAARLEVRIKNPLVG